jgi:hypothetical protein
MTLFVVMQPLLIIGDGSMKWWEDTGIYEVWVTE